MPRVVIVEDEPSLRHLYETKLTLEGFEVHTARDGAEGLDVIRECAPDLILLDLRMPVMTGEEMLRELRANDWGASIRVIILTNISRDEAPSSLRFLAVDRYIVKAHYTPAQVTEIVREVLGMPGKKKA